MEPNWREHKEGAWIEKVNPSEPESWPSMFQGSSAWKWNQMWLAN
jgi:hypothetical protein